MNFCIFLLIKYQFQPLPTDPAELRELAIHWQVPHSHKVESALLEKRIQHTLKSFRRDAPYIVFWLSPLFAAIASLVIRSCGFQTECPVSVDPTPLLSPQFLAIWPAVAMTYVVSFRSHDDRQPSKFIVLAANRIITRRVMK